MRSSSRQNNKRAVTQIKIGSIVENDLKYKAQWPIMYQNSPNASNFTNQQALEHKT